MPRKRRLAAESASAAAAVAKNVTEPAPRETLGLPASSRPATTERNCLTVGTRYTGDPVHDPGALRAGRG